jgi:hypothetical protein
MRLEIWPDVGPTPWLAQRRPTWADVSRRIGKKAASGPTTTWGQLARRPWIPGRDPGGSTDVGRDNDRSTWNATGAMWHMCHGSPAVVCGGSHRAGQSGRESVAKCTHDTMRQRNASWHGNAWHETIRGARVRLDLACLPDRRGGFASRFASFSGSSARNHSRCRRVRHPSSCSSGHNCREKRMPPPTASFCDAASRGGEGYPDALSKKVRPFPTPTCAILCHSRGLASTSRPSTRTWPYPEGKRHERTRSL